MTEIINRVPWPINCGSSKHFWWISCSHCTLETAIDFMESPFCKVCWWHHYLWLDCKQWIHIRRKSTVLQSKIISGAEVEQVNNFTVGSWELPIQRTFDSQLLQRNHWKHPDEKKSQTRKVRAKSNGKGFFSFNLIWSLHCGWLIHDMFL